jgi:hypothetical protein
VRLALYRGILFSYQVQFSRPWTNVHTPIICYGYNLYSVSLFIVLNMRGTLPYIYLKVWCLLCILLLLLCLYIIIIYTFRVHLTYVIILFISEHLGGIIVTCIRTVYLSKYRIHRQIWKYYSFKANAGRLPCIKSTASVHIIFNLLFTVSQ